MYYYLLLQEAKGASGDCMDVGDQATASAASSSAIKHSNKKVIQSKKKARKHKHWLHDLK